jgi:hypothetical protein
VTTNTIDSFALGSDAGKDFANDCVKEASPFGSPEKCHDDPGVNYSWKKLLEEAQILPPSLSDGKRFSFDLNETVMKGIVICALEYVGPFGPGSGPLANKLGSALMKKGKEWSGDVMRIPQQIEEDRASTVKLFISQGGGGVGPDNKTK